MQEVDGAPVRWGGALAVVLALHGMAAWMLLNRGFPPMARPAAPEAVMLDLAPDLPPVQPASVMAPPVPEAPVPPMPVAEPPPIPLVAADAVLPIPPPRVRPKPKVKVVERQVVERQEIPVARPAETHPMEVERMARPSAAPAVAVAPSWRNDLLARLQRAKRYPDLARSHGDQGVAKVTFTLDRGGRVLNVDLVGSSNSALLDDEAVALVRRAEPLPALPDDMPGNTITLTVPISFALR